MASSTKSDVGENVVEDVKKQELQEILASVVQKRKTIPKKCMDLNRKISLLEMKHMEHAKIKLEDSRDRQKFWALLNKLKKTKPAKLSCKDLLEAEERVLKSLKKLQQVNMYLRKRQEHYLK